MRHINFSLFFMILLPLGFQNALASPENVKTQSKTECLGRSLFDIQSNITWHLNDERWDYTDGTGFGVYSPDIRLADKQLSYGSDPTDPAYGLVTIEVSPKTTIDIFNDLVGRHSPSEIEAKKRVMQKKLDIISSSLTGDLSRSNPKKYKSLLDEERTLSKSLARIDKISSELVLLPDLISNLKKQNRPIEKLEAELKAYKEEDKTYPTDEQYAKEIAFDFGMPDAYGAPYPDKLIVLLWRDERIYRFAFGQQSNYSEHRSSFEKLVPVARELLARFRTRSEFEIPQESGFCLPFGFIADDGKAPYSITMAWHPTNNPELLYSLSLSDDIGKALNLLPVLTSPIQGNPFPNAGTIETFGPTSVEIGTREGIIGGKYYKPENPATDKSESAERYIITAGHANKGFEPSLVLKAENYSSKQSQSFEQTKAEFLATLKSFRLLPGMEKLSGDTQAGE